jgi:predicted phosphohydrolase
MRIVTVADTHLFHRDLRVLPAGDILIHAGDLLRGGKLEELTESAEWLRQQPHPHKIFVAGNHDRCFEQTCEQARHMLGDAVIYLQDAETKIDGVRIWGSPWQPAYNEWAFNLPRGPVLAERWQQIPEGIDILITHGPPRGIGDRFTMEEREGCDDLLAAVQRLRPPLHLFGHIHQDGGFWRIGPTCFANVTTWECERGPTVIDFDPSTQEVREVVIPPPRKEKRPRS